MPRKKKALSPDDIQREAFEVETSEYLADVPSLAEQAGNFFSDLSPEEKVVVFYFSENAGRTVELIKDSGIPGGYSERKVKEVLSRGPVKKALGYLGFMDKEVDESDIKRRLTRILMSPMSNDTAALRASTELSKLLALYETKEETENERMNLRNLLNHCAEVDRREQKKGKRKLPTPEETLVEEAE